MKKVLTFFLAFAMAGGCLAQSAPSCEMTIDTLSGCAPFAVEFKFKSVNTDTITLYTGDGRLYRLTDTSEWNATVRHTYELPGRYIPVVVLTQWVTSKDSLGNDQRTREQKQIVSPDTVKVINCPNGIVSSSTESLCVFPNPASGQRRLRYEQGTLQSLQVFNAVGQEVLRQNLEGSEQVVNIATLAKGVYFLRIGTDRATVVRKIVVE